MQKNIVKHSYSVNLDSRKKLKQHRPFLLWFTGLSGSGKSTIANCVEQELYKSSIHTYTLDGDNIRNGLNKDLSFSKKDREVLGDSPDLNLFIVGNLIWGPRSTGDDGKSLWSLEEPPSILLDAYRKYKTEVGVTDVLDNGKH